MRVLSWLRVPWALFIALWVYARTAWWGLAKPRLVERRPLVVAQAVVLGEDGEVLLAVRGDLRGWELPGGAVEEGEAAAVAVVREVEEETGLQVEVEHHVGDYVRTGFRPHTAKVYRCRATGGALRGNWEVRALRWFPSDQLPSTFFPWFHAPLADALTSDQTVQRVEHQGAESILAGMRIDLAMRCTNDLAGLPRN